MPDLLVLADAPEEIILAAGRAVSRVQIAKTGRFTDPRYGNFAITTKDFQKWIDNFNTLNKSDGRIGLPIDVDHNPEKKGDTEAAGWITKLEVRGNELWATAEWNDLGKELVGNRRYAYLSPSYVADYKDEKGKSHGTALLGVGLTNRPFLSMATISLSRYHTTEDTSESYSQEHMPDLPKSILDKLGLAADADEATVLSKITELDTKPEPKSLEDQAHAAGMMLMSTDKVATLSQQASEGAAAARELRATKFETRFDKCLSEGRVVPAQKELFEGMYEKDAEGTLKVLDSLQPVVTVTPTGNAGAIGGEINDPSMRDPLGTFGVDQDALKTHSRALELESERKISYAEAVALAEGEAN